MFKKNFLTVYLYFYYINIHFIFKILCHFLSRKWYFCLYFWYAKNTAETTSYRLCIRNCTKARISFHLMCNNCVIDIRRVAGNNIVLRVYLVECLPMRKRGTCLAVIDMFWIVGYISALGISWSMMPSVIRMLGKQFRPSSWRVLAIVCGTPSLVIACTSGLLPPSPRHSLHRRRLGQALTVLEQMYAINNSKHADTYPPGQRFGRPRASRRRGWSWHYSKVLHENLGTDSQSVQASVQAGDTVRNVSVPLALSWIRLARSVEHARSPGNGRGPRERRGRERHVSRRRPEHGVGFFAKLRRGERGSFRNAVADIAGLRAGRDVARPRNRRHWQKVVLNTFGIGG